MKYYIIGPSCSGKSTYAAQLAKETNLKLINLDEVYFDFSPEKKGKIRISTEELQSRIDAIVKTDNWICEGIEQVPEFFETADKIIYIRASFGRCLYRQWKRYFTNTAQRKRFGFENNLQLSRSLMRQFFQSTNEVQFADIKYSRVSKMDRYCEMYKDKVKFIG